jgi:uncharacterized protein (TIGR03382 family)
MNRLRRHLFAALSFGIALGAASARPAHAQTAGTTGTATVGTLATTDLFIGIQHPQGANLRAFDLPRFFNKQHCDCTEPIYIYVTLTASGFPKRASTPTGTVEFWVGQQCDQILYRTQRCQFIKSEPIATFMALGHDTLATDARVLSTYTATAQLDDAGVAITNTGVFTPTTTCTAPVASFTNSAYVLFDYDSDGVYDLTVTQDVAIDLTPPPVPENIKVAPGNEAVTVSWTPVDYSLNMDLQGYQVLCRRGADLPVFSSGTFGAYLQTCTTAETGTGLEALDPAFVCSPLLNRSDSSYRVKILQNGITYAASVVAIDNSGNASPVVLSNPDNYAIPQKTDSFYDVYRNGDSTNGPPSPSGGATGGFCAVSGRDCTGLGGGVALTVVAAFALAWRRRRRG